MSEEMTAGVVTAGELLARDIKVADISAGHLAIGIWNGKTGEESRMGVQHLYSKEYEERWPRDQYPDKYEEDVDV